MSDNYPLSPWHVECYLQGPMSCCAGEYAYRINPGEVRGSDALAHAKTTVNVISHVPQMLELLKTTDKRIEAVRCLEGGQAITTPADNELAKLQDDIRTLLYALEENYEHP